MFNGKRYILSHDFKRLFDQDPIRAEQTFIAYIRKSPTETGTSSRSDENRRTSSNQNFNQNPTYEEIEESKNTQSFRPNKPLQSYPGAINFPGSTFRPEIFPQQPQHSQRPQQFPQQQQPQRPQQTQRPNSNEPSKYDGDSSSFGHRDDEDEYSIPVQNTGFNLPIPKERERNPNERGNMVTEFAWNLFKNSNNQPNYVLSPLSPQILLTYLAWVADGATRSELLSANIFGSPKSINSIINNLKSDTSGRALQIATAFFHSNEMRLNQEFLEKSIKNVDVFGVDFKQPAIAGRTISKWAEQKTKGALKLNNVNYAPATKIALTSAMYFKGNWIYTFQPAQPGTFYTPSGPVQAPMMNMKRKFRWGKIGNYAEWVALPYESDDSLIIILPNEGQNVDYVMNLMSPRDFEKVVTSIDSESSKADVNITMPKFKLESTTNLIEPLQKVC
jgi:hypothetical protein